MIQIISPHIRIPARPALAGKCLPGLLMSALPLLWCLAVPAQADTPADIQTTIENAVDALTDSKEAERARQQAERAAARKARQEANAAERARRNAERQAKREERRKAHEAALRASREEMQKRQDEANAQKQAAAQAKAEAQQKSCERFEALAQRIESEYPRILSHHMGHGSRDRNAPEAKIPFESWVMSDDLFGKVFGLQYDKMGPEDQMQVQRSVANCQQPQTRDGSIIMGKQLFSRAFDSRFKPRYEPGVQAIRKAQEDYAALEQQLSALPPGKEGLARWRELAREGQRLEPYIAYSQQKVLLDSLRKGYKETVLVAYTEDSADVSANAKGLEGLQSFARLLDTYSEDARKVGMGMYWTPEARKRVEELTTSVVSEERKRIDTMGDGMKGLENGVHWYRDYEQKIKGTGVSNLSGLRDLKYQFTQQREKTLAGATDAFTKKIRSTQNTAELQQLEKQYLLPENDLQTAPGKQIYQQMALWNEELYKRSVLERDCDHSNPVGPTCSEMYDTIYRRIKAITGMNKALYEQCGNVGSGHNPGINMACILGGVMHLGGADESIRIATFKKNRCQPQDTGFLCVYRMTLSGGSFDRLKGLMNALNYVEGHSQALFVKSGNKWVYYAR